MNLANKRISVTVAEVSPDDYERLKQFGVSEVEGRSWSEGARKLEGLELLLRESGFDGNLKSSDFNLFVGTTSTCATLTDYFAGFASALATHMEKRSYSEDARTSAFGR